MDLSHSELAPPLSDTTEVGHDDAEAGPAEFQRREWPLRVVANWQLSWFAASMGTGIIAVDLYNIPYPTTWLHKVSVVFFVANAVLFASLVLVGTMHVLVERDWRRMIDVHGQGLFLGTIPMGFATLITMWTYICVPMWGQRALDAAWGLWIANEIFSVASAAGVLIGLSLHAPTPLHAITPAHLMPFIPPIVSAATGAVIISEMSLPIHKARAVASLSVCYLSLGMGLGFCMFVLLVYFLRLLLHGPPDAVQRSSLLIPLGPLGMSSNTLIALGKAAASIGASNDSTQGSGTGLGLGGQQANAFNASLGQAVHATGTMMALLLWGFGLVWLALACTSFLSGKGRMHFAASFWGLVFPMGVYALAALQLGTVLGDSSIGGGHGGWGVVGTFFTCWLVVNWLIVLGGLSKAVLTMKPRPRLKPT
jgi:tellurite resistance protein TehA-like permease